MRPVASRVPQPGAICTGSPPETFRVRLLSIAHARHAPAIAIAPHGAPDVGRPAHDSTIPPAVINAIPAAIRLSKFSLNTNQASTAVSTPSKFSSSDALEADVFTKDGINLSKGGRSL